VVVDEGAIVAEDERAAGALESEAERVVQGEGAVVVGAGVELDTEDAAAVGIAVVAGPGEDVGEQRAPEAAALSVGVNAHAEDDDVAEHAERQAHQRRLAEQFALVLRGDQSEGGPGVGAFLRVRGDVGRQLVEVLHDAVAGADDGLLERVQIGVVALGGGSEGAATTIGELDGDGLEGHGGHGGADDRGCQGRAIGCSEAARSGRRWPVGGQGSQEGRHPVGDADRRTDADNSGTDSPGTDARSDRGPVATATPDAIGAPRVSISSLAPNEL